MSVRKTLYQVLELSAGAADHEIRAAYVRQLERLRASESRLSREDFVLRQQLLDMALETLGDPVSRRKYDEKLMSRLPASGKPVRATNAVVPLPEPDAITRRAEAMALRAEALALRADAMSLRADLSAPLDEEVAPKSRFSRFMASLGAPWQRVVVLVGTLMAIGMVMQMLFVAYSVRKADSSAAAAAKAEEKTIIQEHYQTYGVRPASAAEARRLEQTYRQREAEERRLEAEVRKEERERQYAAEQERRFLSEARAQAEQVSNNLRNDEERLRQEAEINRAAREEAERRKLDEERQRVEREKEKWREVLNR